MRFTLLIAAAAILAASALAQNPSAPPPPPSAQVRQLLDEHFEQRMRDDPVSASARGDNRFGHLLEDVSPEAWASRRAAYRARLDRLRAIDDAALNDDDRTDLSLLRLELETALDAERFHPEQSVPDNLAGPQIDLPQIAGKLRFSSPKDYTDYAARLEAIPRLLDQHITQLRAGMAAKRMPPRVCVSRIGDQAAAQASPEIARDPAASPFFQPFARLDPDDPLAARARKAIAEGVVPAYRRLATFLQDEYLPACRDSIACKDGIDGLPRYEYELRRHTTTRLTAEQIHQIGRREVARIRAEMMRVIARTDFPQKDSLEGDALFAAFLQYLRTDPRFFFTDKREVLRVYRDICKRIDGDLPAFFRLLPRNPYGVRELPAFAAPTSPTAYYYPGSLATGVSGTFMVNTYRLDQRPRYEMIPLALHEAVPGHHLQMALSDELEGGHPYRRLLDQTVFVEGWALYAERLGLEMAGGGTNRAPRTTDGAPSPLEGAAYPGEPLGGQGLLTDPYDDFGRLTYEMWRACRLVVDTGMHAFGWSRQRAIDFLLTNSALSPFNIEREVDRYIAWPGQACAYKLGELKIRELRCRAEAALGDRFDIRAFHEVVLSAGAIPLDLLEARVDRWIKNAAAPAASNPPRSP